MKLLTLVNKMRAKAMHRRYKARLHRARVAVTEQGMSIRKAAARYRFPKSTLQYNLKKRESTGHAGRPPALTPEEERVVLEALFYYSDCGVPLTRRNVQEALQIFIEQMPESRRNALPFTNGKPGEKFMRSFEKRYRNELKVSTPVCHEAKRHAAVNAETLCIHFAKIERLVDKYKIDKQRMWNLDETGTTPGKDSKGATRQRRYMRRTGAGEMRVPEFVRTSRATVMPVVSADGEQGPPLFVFKGKRLPYREVLVEGRVEVQTFSTFLPRDACVAMREDAGGVDSVNFYNWANMFIHAVKRYTTDGRHVLLVYDGYGAHMALRVIELFKHNRIVAYALPSHTSGKTQPLDVVAFAVFKRELNAAISRLVQAKSQTELDMYEYCAVLKHAYHASFTHNNIVASFRRSGLWPLDAMRLISVPRARDINSTGEILTPEALVALLEKKREEARKDILGSEVHLLRSGFVDTTRGAVLTADNAMEAVRRKENALREKRKDEHEREVQRNAREVLRIERKREQQRKRRELILTRRAKLAQLPLDVFMAKQRSMADRRAIARLRTLRARTNVRLTEHVPVPCAHREFASAVQLPIHQCAQPAMSSPTPCRLPSHLNGMDTIEFASKNCTTSDQLDWFATLALDMQAKIK